MDLVVFGGSRDHFTEDECRDLKTWMEGGGRVLFLVSDADDKHSRCNYKELFSDYGVTVNDDSVMRQIYYKYLHPKEVFIAEGVLVPDMQRKKVRRSTYFLLPPSLPPLLHFREFVLSNLTPTVPTLYDSPRRTQYLLV